MNALVFNTRAEAQTLVEATSTALGYPKGEDLLHCGVVWNRDALPPPETVQFGVYCETCIAKAAELDIEHDGVETDIDLSMWSPAP